MPRHKSKTNKKKKRVKNKDNLLTNLQDYLKDVDKNWNYITSPDLNKKGLNNFFLIDVRKKEDYRKGHIQGAINIFWKDILKPENLKQIPQNKKIIIICYVGHTASQVSTLLRLLGYDAITLKFGMGISPVKGIPVAGWTNYGYETV